MKKALSWVLISTFLFSAVPTTARAGITPVMIPDKDVHMDLNHEEALPRASQFKKPAIDPSPDGSYQVRMIGEKFATVFDPNGEPLVIFDLSLNKLSKPEIWLGAIGFGDLTLFKFYKLLRKARKAHNSDLEDGEAVDVDAGIPALSGPDAREPANQEEALEKAREVFGDLRFTNEWALRNGIPDNEDLKDGVRS